MKLKSLIVLCCIALMQMNVSMAQKGTVICDSLRLNSDPALVMAAYQLGDCMEEIDDIDTAMRLVQIMNLDVVNYYGLNKLYDTRDAREQFKQTPDYKSRLAALTAIKAEKQKHIYYSLLTTSLGKYNWAVKGFRFSMDDLSTPGGLKEAPPPPQTVNYGIELSGIPFTPDPPTGQTISIAVDPDSGMSILHSGKDVTTIVIYKLGKVVQKEYMYLNEQCHCNRPAKEDVIKTDFDRVIIFNPKTSDVFWDVTYGK